jgi:hypothetical protein
MQKFEEPVQNLRGDIIALAPMLVMVAGTETPATVFADAEGQDVITDPRTDRTGVFSFYAPNGRYDIYVMINGLRVGHKLDYLMFDLEDSDLETRVTETSAAVQGFQEQLAATYGTTLVGNGGETVAQSFSALQLPDYDALRAYNGPRKSVYVTGYLGTAAPSGIAGMFVRDDHDTTTEDDGGMVIVTDNGVRFKRQSDYVTPEYYEAAGDNTTDDTDALQAVAAYINAKGGGRVEFRPGAAYRALPDGGTSRGYLLGFQNVKGLTLNFNGALIHVGNCQLSQSCIGLNACSLVRITNARFESDYKVLIHTAGIDWIEATWGSHDIVIDNMDCQYGVSGFTARGISQSAGVDTDRVRNIRISNFNTLGTYYPLHLQNAGDNIVANIRTRNSGRAFFAYNIRNYDVWIDDEHGGPFSPVLLKVYGSTDWDSRLENGRVHYASRGRYAGSGNQSSNEALVAIDCQLNSTNPAPVKIQNLDISFDVEASVSDKMQSLFVVRKYDSTGAADTIDSRGHEITNLTLRGVGRSLQNMLGDAVRLFTRTPDNWTGEYIYNVRVDGLALGTSAGRNVITIDGLGLKGSATIRDVNTAGNLVISNMSGKDFAVDSSIFGNYSQFTRRSKTFASAWTTGGTGATPPTLGNGSLVVEYSTRDGHCIAKGKLLIGSTTSLGTGQFFFKMPFTSQADVVNNIGAAIAKVGTVFRDGDCMNVPGTDTVNVLLGDSQNNFATNAIPGAWTAGDYVIFQIAFPIA